MARDSGLFVLEGYKALGTVWYVEVFIPKTTNEIAALRDEIISLVSLFEKSYSRFRSDSILTELNQKRVTAYDHHLKEMLVLGKEMQSMSSGVFRLAVLDKLTEKGYGEHVHKSEYADEGFEVTDKEIRLHGTASVDLGGIGKGYLIDMIAARLVELGVHEFVVNGGGDLYATHNKGRPITVLLQHPFNLDESIGSVELYNQSLCASSSFIRSWEKDGIKRNHFVSKDGSEVWSASYTIGGSATRADMAATVLCLLANNKEEVSAFAHVSGVSYLVYVEELGLYGNMVRV